jgi:hypothetical protein
MIHHLFEATDWFESKTERAKTFALAFAVGIVARRLQASVASKAAKTVRTAKLRFWLLVLFQKGSQAVTLRTGAGPVFQFPKQPLKHFLQCRLKIVFLCTDVLFHDIASQMFTFNP